MKDKILLLSKKIIRHELISGSFYVFAGSIIANILAFIFNLFLVRSLTSSDYGIYASLLSLITLVSVPAQSLTPVIVRFAARYFAKNEINKAKAFYLKMLNFILLTALTLFLAFLIFSLPIKNFLKIENIWHVVLTGAAVAISYLNLINSAYIQSLLKFGFLSLLSVASGLVKLLTGVILIWMGFKIFGGLWAIFFMGLTSFILGFIPVRRIFKSRMGNEPTVSAGEILSYAFPATITILFLTSFTSTDVILVKHFFNPSQAGLYGGLSLVGKVIFYFTGPVSVVMFPLLVKRHALGKNFINLFYLSLSLVALPSLMATIFYFLYPNFVIKFLLGGGEYLNIAPFLGFFGAYLTVFSLLNVCVNFFLSLGKTKIYYLVVLGALLEIALIYLFHSSFYQVIFVSLAVSSLLFISLLYVFFRSYGNFRKIKESAVFLTTSNV